MTVALFLQLMQILNAMGGASVAFIAIRKDIEARGLKPEDLLPAEHEATVRRLLPLRDSTAADFIENTLGK
jgi:hypothetical protein